MVLGLHWLELFSLYSVYELESKYSASTCCESSFEHASQMRQLTLDGVILVHDGFTSRVRYSQVRCCIKSVM